MIKRLSHASVYVLDQESARDFYVTKLGFAEKMKIPLGNGAFWLTVAPHDQPDLEITLMPVLAGDMFQADEAEKLAELIRKGTFGFGVFECKDIYATYEELKGRGVEFFKEPTEQFYGIEAMFRDDSGNWFSLTQFKEENT